MNIQCQGARGQESSLRQQFVTTIVVVELVVLVEVCHATIRLQKAAIAITVSSFRSLACYCQYIESSM